MKTEREDFRGAVSMRRLLLIMIAVALLGISASAQTTVTNRINQKFPIDGVVANPCVPENVSFSGFAHIVATVRVQPDGTIHVTLSDKFTGQGTGVETGLKYSVGGNTTFNAKFRPDCQTCPFLLRERDRAVSQGPTDNFFVVMVLHFNGNGELVQVSADSFCRG